MPSLLLALGSSLLWGVSDFLGGIASRRSPTLVVVLVSQSAGLLLALVTAAATGSFSAPIGYLPWAIGAGLAGAGAVLLFYRALAIGTMGVVAPLASLGVLVPVVIGLATGRLPSVLCLAGVVVAIAGVVITAGLGRGGPGHGGPGDDGRARRSVLLAIGAALGFGVLQYAISGGAAYSVVMTMTAMRVTSVPVLGVAAFFAFGPAARPTLTSEKQLRPGIFALIAVVGLFDVGANLLFADATVAGALAVVAVLGSLYPAVTVLLARVVDGERMTRMQNVCVLTALAGVAMISLGS